MVRDPYSKLQWQCSMMVSLLSIKIAFHFNHHHSGQALLPFGQVPAPFACHNFVYLKFWSSTILSASNSLHSSCIFTMYYVHNVLQIHVFLASCNFSNIPRTRLPYSPCSCSLAPFRLPNIHIWTMAISYPLLEFRPVSNISTPLDIFPLHSYASGLFLFLFTFTFFCFCFCLHLHIDPFNLFIYNFYFIHEIVNSLKFKSLKHIFFNSL